MKTAKYVTPGDKRLGESIKPFIKESNTILLATMASVCYGPDLEERITSWKSSTPMPESCFWSNSSAACVRWVRWR